MKETDKLKGFLYFVLGFFLLGLSIHFGIQSEYADSPEFYARYTNILLVSGAFFTIIGYWFLAKSKSSIPRHSSNTTHTEVHHHHHYGHSNSREKIRTGFEPNFSSNIQKEAKRVRKIKI